MESNHENRDSCNYPYHPAGGLWPIEKRVSGTDESSRAGTA